MIITDAQVSRLANMTAKERRQLFETDKLHINFDAIIRKANTMMVGADAKLEEKLEALIGDASFVETEMRLAPDAFEIMKDEESGSQIAGFMHIFSHFQTATA